MRRKMVPLWLVSSGLLLGVPGPLVGQLPSPVPGCSAGGPVTGWRVSVLAHGWIWDSQNGLRGPERSCTVQENLALAGSPGSGPSLRVPAALPEPPAAAAAEPALELSPHVGLYVPVGWLVDVGGPGRRTHERRRQVGAGMVGARLAMKGGEFLRLEASAGYSPSLVAVTDSVSTKDLGAGVVFASVRGVLRVSPGTLHRDWSFYLGSGIGLIDRHGAAWETTRGTTDVALVLSAGARLGLRRSTASFRLEVEDFLSWAEFRRPARLPTPGRVQHDVLWSFGLGIPVGGSR